MVAAEDALVVLLQPQDEGGPPIPVLHGTAGISGVTLGRLFIRLIAVDFLFGNEGVRPDAVVSESRAEIAGVSPMADGEFFGVDFTHGPVFGIVVTSTPPSIIKAVLQLAHLIKGDEGKVGDIAALSRGSEKCFGARDIVAFEILQRHIGFGVTVLQQDSPQVSAPLVLEPRERSEQGPGLGIEREIERRGITLIEAQIIDQAAAVARAHGLNLMLTISEESGMLEIVEMLFLTEIDLDFPSVMAHEETPARVGGG